MNAKLQISNLRILPRHIVSIFSNIQVYCTYPNSFQVSWLRKYSNCGKCLILKGPCVKGQLLHLRLFEHEGEFVVGTYGRSIIQLHVLLMLVATTLPPKKTNTVAEKLQCEQCSFCRYQVNKWVSVSSQVQTYICVCKRIELNTIITENLLESKKQNKGQL